MRVDFNRFKRGDIKNSTESSCGLCAHWSEMFSLPHAGHTVDQYRGWIILHIALAFAEHKVRSSRKMSVLREKSR